MLNISKYDEGLNARWQKERDEVVKTYDVEKFKDFYRKYQLLGVYPGVIQLPSDKVIEATMHKMVYHMKSATAKEKAEAKAWLKAHKSDTNI